MTDLKPLEHQVAGHPSSVLTSEDGSYIVKPSLPLEVEFYQTTAPAHFTDLLEKGFIPQYHGVQEHNVPPKEGKVKIEQAIKLENLTHGFVKPNVIDLKLGTQLFDPLDPNLTSDKQSRMEAESARTTSGSDGVRLTGFSVYDAKTDSYVSTPKEYGKAIPSSELANGIRRYFPCSDEQPSVHASHQLTPTPPEGLPASVLLPILKTALARVTDFRAVVSDYEMRMYGGSLLLVYEGKQDAADPSKLNLKLIDFAHTRYLPGHGPDEGLLKGVDTVARLLEGRIAEVQALAQ